MSLRQTEIEFIACSPSFTKKSSLGRRKMFLNGSTLMQERINRTQRGKQSNKPVLI